MSGPDMSGPDMSGPDMNTMSAMKLAAARRRVVPAALLALLPAACLEVSDREPPMCKTTADCDAGEICEESVCWGNPPEGAIAAVVSPPSERSADLVSREVLMLPITSDGWLDNVRLDAAVSFKGRLQALCGASCDGRMIGATITVTRPSVFLGGPGFRKVFTIEDESFELKVPATQPGDPPFTITVVPAGRDAPGTGTSPIAQQVPPLQIQQAIPASSSGNVLELGGLTLPRITGRLVTLGGTSLQSYRVVALGRWAEDQPPTEVSSVDFTSFDGEFEIKLSRGLAGPVELVARPFGAQLRPELHLSGLSGQLPVQDTVLTLPGSPSGELGADVVVDHKDTGGEIARVAGARVIIAASSTDAGGVTTRFSAEGVTTDEGVVRLKLLGMPALLANYRLTIIPPAGSKAAALFEKPYQVQGTTSQRLGTRIAITGSVYGTDGEPAEGVSVTAQPSVRFLWNLEPGPQAFLGEIPAATVTTSNSGEFVLFVDHTLPSGSSASSTPVWGSYDLSFEPTAKSRMASWTKTGVELPRDAAQSTAALGPIHLPDAAYVRGAVFDHENARIEGAEVKLYRVQPDTSPCRETRYEPPSCPIPPLLLGRATTDDDGIARLTLPR
jgi:hypothetical protein